MGYRIGLALLLMGIYMAAFAIASKLTNAGVDLMVFSFLPALLGFVIMLGGARGGKTDKSNNDSDTETKE